MDLGLTSGTLWSSHYLKDKYNFELPYIEAAKLSIPTVAQYEELCRECVIVPQYGISVDEFSGFKFIGKTGKSICIDRYNVSPTLNVRESYYFWLKDDVEGSEKDCACLWGKDELGYPNKHKIFMGLKSPVMLVK